MMATFSRGLRWPSLLLLAGGLLAGCNNNSQPTTGTTANAPSGANGATGGTGAQTGGRIVLITNGSSPFWQAVEKGMNDANAKFPIQASLIRNDGTPAGQIQKLEQVNAQGDIKAVAISCLDPKAKGITDLMTALMKKGVRVITFDSDAPKDTREAYIGANNVNAGKQAGKAAAALQPQGGKVVAFVGTMSADNAKERLQGFKDGAGPKFQVAATMEDQVDPNKARQNVTAAIQAHPEATVMLGLWSYNAPAIAEEVMRANKRSHYKLVTFDAEPNTITQLQKGVIDATVVQQPYQYGYLAVQLLNAMVGGDTATVTKMVPASKIVDVPVRTVISNPNGPIKTGGDVWSVDQLVSYLKEKGLKGS